MSSPSAADSDCAAEVDELLDGIDRIRIEDLWKTPRPSTTNNNQSRFVNRDAATSSLVRDDLFADNDDDNNDAGDTATMKKKIDNNCNNRSSSSSTASSADYAQLFAPPHAGPFAALPPQSAYTHHHHLMSTSVLPPGSSATTSSSSSPLPLLDPANSNNGKTEQLSYGNALQQQQDALSTILAHHLGQHQQQEQPQACSPPPSAGVEHHQEQPLGNINNSSRSDAALLQQQHGVGDVDVHMPPSNNNTAGSMTNGHGMSHPHRHPHHHHGFANINNSNHGHSQCQSYQHHPHGHHHHHHQHQATAQVDASTNNNMTHHHAHHHHHAQHEQQQHDTTPQPLHQQQAKHVPPPPPPGHHPHDFPRMFKVLPCPTRELCQASGDTAECFYWHDVSYDRRRVNVSVYKPHMCRFVDEPGGCRKAERCPFAHNDFERRYHPDRFGKETCRDFLRGDCPRRYCTFRHHVSRKVSVALEQVDCMADKEMLQFVLKISEERGRALCDKLLRRFGHGKKHSGWKLEGFDPRGRDDQKVRFVAMRVEAVKKRLKTMGEKKWAASLKTCSLRDMMSGVRKVAEEMRERCRTGGSGNSHHQGEQQQQADGCNAGFVENGGEVHRLIRSVFSNTNWSCHSQEGDNPFLVTPDNQNDAVSALERLVQCLVEDGRVIGVGQQHGQGHGHGNNGRGIIGATNNSTGCTSTTSSITSSTSCSTEASADEKAEQQHLAQDVCQGEEEDEETVGNTSTGLVKAMGRSIVTRSMAATGNRKNATEEEEEEGKNDDEDVEAGQVVVVEV